GEILVRTPMIDDRAAAGDDMDGRLVDGWFHTGDLGRIDDEGFLWIEGRVSDMINRGGLKVFPEEVAEVIRLSPAVAQCAVAGIPPTPSAKCLARSACPPRGGAPTSPAPKRRAPSTSRPST